MRASTCVVLGAWLAAPAAAHHSTALVYHRDGPIIEAEGVITAVAWVNPHVRLEMRGTGPDGVERLYKIESNSVSTVSRFGLTAELVAAGTRVKVAGNGGRHADDVLWLTNLLLPGGEEILFGAAVKARWSERTIGSDIRSAVAADAEGLGLFRVWSNVTNPVTFWGNDLPLTPAATATRAAFDPLTDEPTANCAPKGMPFIMEQPYPMRFVDAGSEIRMEMEEYDTVRRIVLNGAPPASTAPGLLGVSTGRWEGRTLVVTTTDVTYRHFNGTGIPLGPGARFDERFTLSEDGSRLDYTLTVTDAATFTAPVTLRKAWEYRPGEVLKPYECR